MKKYVKLMFAICLCSSLFFIGCAKQENAKYAIVSGILTNVGESEVRLASKYISISMDTVPSINNILKVDESGVFTDTVYIDRVREFSIGQDRSWTGFLIKPGQHVQLTIDFKDFQNSIKFEGDGVSENTFLLKKAIISERKNSEYKTSEKDNEATFIKKQEGYFNENMRLIDSSEGLSEEFIANAKKDFLYEKVMSYIAYEVNYKRIHGEDAPELSSDFLALLSKVNLKDYSEFKRSTTYQFLLRRIYDVKYASEVDDIWTADPIIKLNIILNSISDKNLLDELFIMFGKNDITRSKNVQKYYDLFMANVSNQYYRDVVTSQYKDILSTQPGQPAPEFVDYKNSNGGTNSLSDFRGKYVYIDVWATWCGPCRGETPYFKKVAEAYRGKNIEFIGLSVDNRKNTDKWKQYIKKNELKTVQLITDKESDSYFIKKFQIKGIPRFILIDPEGKIVRADAPRPSDEKLIELFTELGL